VPRGYLERKKLPTNMASMPEEYELRGGSGRRVDLDHSGDA
jgi:hypothetical protein